MVFRKKAIEYFDNMVEATQGDYGVDEEFVKYFVENAEVRIRRKMMRDEVIEDMLNTGLIRNQFETRNSSGYLSPYKEGARDIWEGNLFNYKYQNQEEYKKIEKYKQLPQELAAQRPKYGYLVDKTSKINDNAEQYGAVEFVLKPYVLERCTFTIDNSSRFTYDIMKTLSDRSAFERNCFNLKNPERVIADNIKFAKDKERYGKERTNLKESAFKLSNSCFYNEAQIHGEIHIGKDVEKIYIRKDLMKRIIEESGYEEHEHEGMIKDTLKKVIRVAEKWKVPYEIIEH